MTTAVRCALKRTASVLRVLALFAVVMLFVPDIQAQESPAGNISTPELQREVESLRSAVHAQAQSLRYLLQSDSAGLAENPYVQRQISLQVEQAYEEFVQRTTMWIFIFVGIVLGLILLLFVIRYALMKRMHDLEYRLTRLQNAVDEDAVAREMGAVDRQEDSLQKSGSPAVSDDPFSPFADHRLPLRVADEIQRMRKRLQYMDEDTKGLSALKHSLRRLEDQLNDAGYELVDLRGKKYVDGLNVEARFVPAEDEALSEETITDIIRPQVNYMGVIIQQAKVEVSKSYS